MLATAITLESLLAQEDDYSDITQSPAEIALEMTDIEREISILNANLTTYEAAKAIHKAKAKKKAVKITKTKMKAKDAKAKKATSGKKVVKIRKATKEDDELDGGTGPLPTTSDTDGLTDTDLDAAPEQEVEVIESDGDATPQEVEVGTEGVDYMMVYEDEDQTKIDQAANGAKDTKKNIFQKFIEALKKLGELIANIVKNLFNFSSKLEKAWKANKAKYIEALKGEGGKLTVSTFKKSDTDGLYTEIMDLCEKGKSYITRFDGKATDLDAYEWSDDATKEIEKFNGIKEKMKNIKFSEMTVSDSGWDASAIDEFITKAGPAAQKKLKELGGAVKNAIESAKRASSNGGDTQQMQLAGTAEAVGATFNRRGVQFLGKLYARVGGNVAKLIKAVVKGGGKSSEDGSKEGENKEGGTTSESVELITLESFDLF